MLKLWNLTIVIVLLQHTHMREQKNITITQK